MLSMDLATPQVPGTFVYNPPAGTVEPVGTDTLSVTFTPTDTTDYTTATGTVQLVVTNPVTPIVTPTGSRGRTPAPITYGTPLSSVQLNAVAMGTPRLHTEVIPTEPLQVIATSTDGTQYNQPGFDNAGGTYSYNQAQQRSRWSSRARPSPSSASQRSPNAITNGAVYTLPVPGNYSTSLPDWRRNHHRADQPAPSFLNYATGNPVTQTTQHELVGLNQRVTRVRRSWPPPRTKTPRLGGEVAGTFGPLRISNLLLLIPKPDAGERQRSQ